MKNDPSQNLVAVKKDQPQDRTAVILIFLLVDIVVLSFQWTILGLGSDNTIFYLIYRAILVLCAISVPIGIVLLSKQIKWGVWLLVAPLYPLVGIFALDFLESLIDFF